MKRYFTFISYFLGFSKYLETILSYSYLFCLMNKTKTPTQFTCDNKEILIKPNNLSFLECIFTNNII